MDPLALLVNLATRESLVQLVLLAHQAPAVALAKEVNKAPLVQPAFLELLDKMESLVGKETKALLANEAKLGPQGQPVHQEAPVRPALQVHKEEKESGGHQVLRVRQAFLVLVVYLVLPETMVTQGNLAMQVLRAKMGLLVHLVLLVLLAPLVVQVQKVSLACQVKKVQLVQEVKRVHLVLQDFLAHPDSEVLLDCQAGEVYQALLVWLAPGVKMASQEPMVAQENEDLQGHKVPLALVDLQESQAEMVTLDQTVCQAVTAPQDQRAIVVKMVLLVYPDPLAILVPLVALAQLENQATEDSPELLVPLAPLAPPAFVVLLVPLVHVVIKAKLANVVSMA